MPVEKLKEREEEEHLFFFDEDEDEDILENKYLTFKIADEVYGIIISNITEIIELQKITEVPDMPKYVKGVINLRGKVIPIMDLRIRFKMEKREYDDRTCIVIVNINEKPVGFIVDTVLEVVDIPKTEIEPSPQFKNESSYEKYVSGLGKVGDEIKILLDVGKIIYLEDLVNIDKKNSK